MRPGSGEQHPAMPSVLSVNVLVHELGPMSGWDESQPGPSMSGMDSQARSHSGRDCDGIQFGPHVTMSRGDGSLPQAIRRAHAIALMTQA